MDLKVGISAIISTVVTANSTTASGAGLFEAAAFVIPASIASTSAKRWFWSTTIFFLFLGGLGWASLYFN
jgi:hypothetical protein